MKKVADSELIINPDGSIFHLHMRPGQLGKTVFLVGDPARVEMISGFFEEVLYQGANREFVWKTGLFKGSEVTALSTGIGTDNIDIVLNELDALVNFDFKTRMPKNAHTSLDIIRIGTSGSLQKDVPVDSWVLSKKAVGLDGLLNFYKKDERYFDSDFQKAITDYTGIGEGISLPYVVDSSLRLFEKINSGEVISGATVTAPGFYGPQGRVLRLPVAKSDINQKLASFRYKGLKLLNYEMECSAIYGLSALLGHNAVTVCAIIANRAAGLYSKDYKVGVKKMTKYVLESLI
ncbi:nucleoside phosphorylase [Marinilabiliaceae bacterium ANBcel2]|nr:nucleoside phosphorylase [Marinilabiliaceae bacterium ANBcel2]